MMGLRLYAWSLVISAVLVAGVVALASVPHVPAVGIVLLPGALLAAIVFPQGPHSSEANLWFVLAGLLNVALFAFPVMWMWALIQRRKATPEIAMNEEPEESHQGR
jgi:hypothetical protein